MSFINHYLVLLNLSHSTLQSIMFTLIRCAKRQGHTIRNQVFCYSTQSLQGTKKSIWQSLDRSMYYPVILLVLFGSQVINVMNSKREVENLERRYQLKISKIDELKERVGNGEIVDVNQELGLINKIFERSEKGGNKIRFDGQTYSRPNNEGIIEDFDEKKLNELFGLDDETITKMTNEAEDEKTSTSSSTTIIDKNLINEQVQNEKNLVNYKLNPELHVIVEKPGDYVEAAKETRVSKFL